MQGTETSVLGTAGRSVGVIHHAFLAEFGVSVAVIAIESPICRTGGFSRHDNDEEGDAQSRKGQGTGSEFYPRLSDFDRTRSLIRKLCFDCGVNDIDWSQQIAGALLTADEVRESLEVSQQRNNAENNEGNWPPGTASRDP